MQNLRMHIRVIAEARYWGQLQPSGMIKVLRLNGHQVTIMDPDHAPYEAGENSWMCGIDLIVSRGRSLELLCLLAAAEAAGLRTINRRAAIGRVLNKAEMAAVLAANSIRMPHTYFGAINRLPDFVSRYPLIVKPVFGDNAQGLRIVNTPGELRELEWETPAPLAQEYIPNEGYDLKLYGIGDEVWAVRKPSPVTRLQFPKNQLPDIREMKAETVTISEELSDLGRRCGRLFDLELYGVDCILTPDGPVVIEVNDFPNYSAVPNADEKLAAYVLRVARQEAHA